MKKITKVLPLILCFLFLTGCMSKVEKIGEIQYIRNEVADHKLIYGKIDDISIETMNVDDIINLIGEPDEYTWNSMSYDYSILPSRYLMVYSDILKIQILDNKIVELQIYGNDYLSDQGLEIGMTAEEFESTMTLEKTIEGGNLEFVDGVYYKNIRDIEGKSYYEYDNMRVHFYEGLIVSIYFTNPLLDLEEAMYTRLYGGYYNNLLWKDIYGISFLTDSRVLGKWKCVDYVDNPDGYDSSLQYNEELMFSYIKFIDRRIEITLNSAYKDIKLEDYALSGELFWSRGYIFNNRLKTAQAYFVYEVAGKPHLFVQDKNWTYSLHGVKPSYYVFTRTE